MNINLTLIGQMIAFAMFVWFCMKYVWPPVITAMQERQKRMAEGLQNAERAQHDLDIAKQKAAETIREAKQQAAELIEQANKRAGQLIDQAKNQARTEGERIKSAAQAEIEQEVQRAKEQLRGQVSALAVAGAQQILQRTIDSNAHADLLNKLASEL